MARITLCTSNCTMTNASTSVASTTMYTNVLTPKSGYVFDINKVVVKMGGNNIYALVSPQSISITTAIIGDIYIEAYALPCSGSLDMTYLGDGTYSVSAKGTAQGYIDSDVSTPISIEVEV